MKNTLKDNEVKLQVIKMDKEGISRRKIARELGLKSSTVGDFLRKESHVLWWRENGSSYIDDGGDQVHSAYVDRVPDLVPPTPDTKPSKVFTKKAKVEPLHIETSLTSPDKSTHFFIPDLQIKPDIDMSYLSHIGKYMAKVMPDVIINIGDHFDLPSLSSYDRGTKKAEGKHLYEDINAGVIGMNLLLQPIYDLQQKQLMVDGKITYKPKMVFTIGNHEQRLERHLNANPELTDLVSYTDFKLGENGWEVYDFLEPAVVNGIMYIHYAPNPMTGKPYGGSALNILKNTGCSISMGHKQCLDVATRSLPTGQTQWMLICGAGYPHMEGYKGYTGNHHFRGVVVKHRVSNGSYEPMFVNLEYLKEKYGEQ